MKKISATLTSVITLFSLSLPMFVPVAVQAQTTSTTGSCYTFTRNLGEGRPVSSAEGAALAADLSAEGFWNANTPITSYTDAVASAITGFQQKYASQILTPNGLTYGTGYVGVSTRTELNSLYGCSTSSSTTTSTSTGGQTFQCPSGWVCTAPAPTPTPVYTCPLGWTCAPTKPITPPNTITTTPIINPTTTTVSQSTPGSLIIGAQDQVVTFTKNFSYNSSGQVLLTIAADNEYSVSVNGTQVALNSNEDNFFSPAAVYDISNAVHQGSNSLSITVVNQWSSGYGLAWAGNPAGLDYSITNGGNVITASDGTEQISGGADIVIPQSLLNFAWTNIPGASWVWSPSLLTAAAGSTYTGQTSQCPTGYVCSTTTTTNSSTNSATILLDGISPLTGTVQVTNSVQGQYLSLPVLVFDVSAHGDTLHLHQVSVNVTGSGSGVVSAAYLFQGGIPIASASIVNGVATFQNISDGQAGASIPINTTVPFTIKADVSGVTGGVSEAVTASLSSSNQIIYSSIDSNVPVSGSANGNTQTVVNGNGYATSTNLYNTECTYGYTSSGTPCTPVPGMSATN